MEIVFEAKKVLQVVFGLEKHPIPVDPEHITPLELNQIDTWNERNANAHIFINKSIS